ncbi:hypothetical protein LRS40_16180 [Leclercia sp. G3L]|uniref:phage head spike fiber domain-containing protein n=1 Tax=Leclercia sp. G3L TaxID=2898725 RepID=UPI001E28AC67|nr:hypothetical protein [Leclercia sp. G3L]UGB01225.1 hypothetical protein LRS40_16180 [Leclercia sp. G3L]
MATLDDDLANAVTEGFRLAQSSIINQDLILSGTGDVTVTLANGSKKTGPSWSKLITAANAAGTSATAAKTSETNALASKNAAATSATNAATSEGNALASKNAAKTSETNAKTSETNARTSENNAGASASSAAASLAAAQQLTSAPYEAAPYPDVWAPLNDDLRLLAGIAPYDRIAISGQVLELASKSVTFSRSTTATYIDKSGLMVTAEINEPRFEKQGLLLESSSTNLYIYSETIGAGSGVTATSNASTSPTGENTMSLITENTAGGEHYAGDRNIALTAGTSYCFSTYVKASQGNRWLYLRTASGTTSGTFFDVTNGKWGSDNFSAPITDRGFESLGNGIYRVWMVFTATNTQSTVIRLQLSQPGQVATYTGDGASGLYLWGAQLEESTFPSSYIKTVASTVTRSPDLWSIVNTNTGYQTLADKFKRTVAFEFMPKYTITTGYADVVRVPGATNDIICRVIAANRIQSFRDGSGTPSIPVTPGVLAMVVHVTSVDDCTMYYDGNPSYRAQLPSNTTTKPTNISNSVGSANGKFVYYIRNFRIWHRELTVNQIKGLR